MHDELTCTMYMQVFVQLTDVSEAWMQLVWTWFDSLSVDSELSLACFFPWAPFFVMDLFRDCFLPIPLGPLPPSNVHYEKCTEYNEGSNYNNVTEHV